MRISTSAFLVLAVACAGLFGCSQSNNNASAGDELDLSGRDTSIAPSQNFFEYTNGNWVKNTRIPPSKTGWGSFYIVRDQALANMKVILDSCEGLTGPAKGSVSQQIGDLYHAAMDSARIDGIGLTPLQGDLAAINGVRNMKDFLALVSRLYRRGDGFVIGMYIAPDDKNSNVERSHFDQAGLGLPNRDYYFKNDSTSVAIRQAYQRYVTRIISLAGDSAGAAKKAAAIIALETRMAAASKPPVALRDPQANYHLVSVDQMEKEAPNFSWKQLLSALGVTADTLQVGQPDYYKTVSGLLKTISVATWREYLRFHLVSSYASWLSKPFSEAHFDFYNRLLNGQKQPEDRWKRAASLIDGTLGDALGQIYVKRFFPPSAKAYMMKLVDNLQDTYQDRLQHNEWMSDSTKTKAIDKLEAFVKKIGYPDKWKDYSSIDISRDSLITDLQRIGVWQYDYNIAKLGKPVDKTEWYMTPPTVNAYYNPPFNEIVFPAGILQPPFYFQSGDDAVNYGGIGAVIGHEMTHGFDDQGSQYDKDGNLKNWWTAADRKEFEKRADQVVREYNAYTVLDSIHVNGKLTEGENIADVGGLAIAYAAFKRTPEGQSTRKVNGLTPDERFFLSFAQIWRIKTTPERLLWRINNDPHSPEMYRVNGPTSNMTAFYETFNVKPGDAMYRADSVRVHIW